MLSTFFSSLTVILVIFTKSDNELVRSFASNKSIIVPRPDNGNGVVVLDINRYLSSVVDLISDIPKFEGNS